MKCEEVHEHLSALCDGERIPSDAAEHIGACESCRERVNGYLKIGVELRRLASVDAGEVREGAWQQTQRKVPSWWGKGWETMRIPRFAFALLLITIVALGSGLVMSKVRAQTHGSVLLLTYKLPTGLTNRCALSLVDEKQNLCTAVVSPNFILLVKTLSQNGDQIELGVHAQYKQLDPTVSIDILDELKKIEEKHYWITPGQDLQVNITAWGDMTLSGELVDHLPPAFTLDPDIQMDPKPGKLQLISPLLLRDKKVWFDFENSGAMGQRGALMYVHGKGLWKMSLSPLEGGVEAKVSVNRISFELNGHSYLFITAVPVVRTNQRVWVSVDENYQGTTGAYQALEGIDPAHWNEFLP